MNRLLLIAVVAVSIVTGLDAQTPPLLAQQPALGATQIVFVFGGDLWSVPRQGGDARRLTVGVGLESDPVFSPDGRWIAFTGEYDGNTDVFVMAAEGGVPRRLTWHPAPDRALGWSRDGSRILFSSPRDSYSNFAQLFLVHVDGGFEERLPLPTGYEGGFSSDGGRLAYVPLPRAFDVWKRYRGGRATPIWIADLSTSRVEKLPRTNSNDFAPMWIDSRIFFLSDRNGPVTLFSYDTRSRRVTQALRNDGMDFKSASAGPGGIAIEQFGQLHLYDLASGRLNRVDVRLAGDMPEVRPKLVNVGRRLTSAHISPTGARALFEARGEIVTVPAEKGDARNLTETPGVMERDPAWSPDGAWIAYFSDAEGEYALHVRNSGGGGETRIIALEDEPTFYFLPQWSPDSRKIAYLDAHLGLWYVDVAERKPIKVDTDRYLNEPAERRAVWSPDSKWLAYAKRLPNYLNAVFVYSLADSRTRQITDGMSDARYPVFDRSGKYLFFTASTDSGPSLELDVSSSGRTLTQSIYVTVLSSAEPSPFAPESDEEPPSATARAAEQGEPAPPGADAARLESPRPRAVPDVRIDFDRIGQRILAMPLPPRRYMQLQTGKAGVLFALEAPAVQAPAADTGVTPDMTVHRYVLSDRRGDVLHAGVRFFEISANGEKTLTAQGDRWSIQTLRPLDPAGDPAAPAPAPADGPGALDTDSVEVRSDPRAEWKQMYDDAWRIQREFFYEPNLHGLNLSATKAKYEPYVTGVMSRRDLNYVFADMMGDMTVSHLDVFGGEMPETRTVPVGLLGADYQIENGRYRFARIYDGENWNPDLRAPLTQPGVDVREGEYLLAVNGRALRGSDNVYSLFEATAGKNVVLRVGSNPDGSGSREVTVNPVASEARLRHLAWIEENRRKVDAATNGRVAYVYMPDTAFGGMTSFRRYYYAQVGKEAVIIDERFNDGGMLATDIVEHLQRRMLSLVASRDGDDEVQPQGAIFGPKVMIVNEFAQSGGDALPNYFRRAGVGKLIGKRTWGGLVGRNTAPPLMDGGVVSAPASAVWGPEGQWDAENIGIEPDIEVEHDPELVRQGRDPQLERAIQEIMSELEKKPVPKPKRPAYPNHHQLPTPVQSK